MNLPPPLIDPKDWAPPPKRPVLPFLLAGVGAVFLIGMILAAAFVPGMVRKAMSEVVPPPPHPEPTITYFGSEGRVMATFPDAPLTLDLPARPKLMENLPSDYTFEDRRGLIYSARYDTQYADGSVTIYLQWLRPSHQVWLRPDRFKEYARYYVSGWTNETPTIGKLEGSPEGSLTVDYGYTWEGQAAKGHVLLIPFEDGVAGIVVTPYPGIDGQTELRRIGKSAKLVSAK